MPFATARRRPHALVVGSVLALHLLLLLGLLRLGTWADRSKPVAAQAPVLLRLLPLALTVPAPAQPDAAARPARPAGLPPDVRNDVRAGAPPRPPAPSAPQPITLPAASDGPSAPATDATVAGSAAAASVPASAPLDLRLHRGFAGAGLPARNPALDDPRARMPRATLASRLAAAMGGDGVWHEEPMDSGDNTRVRLRRGDQCVEVYKAREAQLNPYNQSVSKLPAQLSKAKPC